MWKQVLVAWAMVLGGACMTRPTLATPAPTSAPAEVLAAEDARFTAMLHEDVLALDTLLADDVLYTHTTGLTETKAQFLESLRVRRLTYDSIVPGERLLRQLAPGVAVISGQARMVVRVGTEARRFEIRFTDVLVLRGRRWLTVIWQSTRSPSD
jgi:hypothetical protein